MDILSTVIEVGTRLVEKVNEIRALNEECRNLADIVSKLQPIFAGLDEQLHKPEHRSIMETLLKALTDAEEVVDYIIEHPRYAALRSGTYKIKLEDAIKNIDAWIVRIQPFTSGETFQKLRNLKTDVAAFSNELSIKLDDISGSLQRLENMQKEDVRQIRDELSSLLHQQQGKNPRFQRFVDEEERRMSQSGGYCL